MGAVSSNAHLETARTGMTTVQTTAINISLEKARSAMDSTRIQAKHSLIVRLGSCA